MMEVFEFLELSVFNVSDSLIQFQYLYLNLRRELVIFRILCFKDLSTQRIQEDVLSCIALIEVEEILRILLQIFCLDFVLRLQILLQVVDPLLLFKVYWLFTSILRHVCSTTLLWILQLPYLCLTMINGFVDIWNLLVLIGTLHQLHIILKQVQVLLQVSDFELNITK